MKLLRNALSSLAGVVAAGLCIAAIETLAHSVVDGESVFAAVIAGYGIGAFAGSWIAARFGDWVCAVVVTGMLAVLAAVNLFAFPHPTWFAPTAVVALLLGWASALRLTGRMSTVGQRSGAK